MRILTGVKGGKLYDLVGAAQAMPPYDHPWEWTVRLGKKTLARGTASSKRQAVREIEEAMTDALGQLECYCAISDEPDDLGTEYYRVVDIFVPDTFSPVVQQQERP